MSQTSEQIAVELRRRTPSSDQSNLDVSSLGAGPFCPFEKNLITTPGVRVPVFCKLHSAERRCPCFRKKSERDKNCEALHIYTHKKNIKTHNKDTIDTKNQRVTTRG